MDSGGSCGPIRALLDHVRRSSILETRMFVFQSLSLRNQTITEDLQNTDTRNLVHAFNVLLPAKQNNK
jgi:hypothetical protein